MPVTHGDMAVGFIGELSQGQGIAMSNHYKKIESILLDQNLQ